MSELSPTERSIADFLVEGLPNKVIANRLDMAETTVKVHIKHLNAKLGTTNRTQIAILIDRQARARMAYPAANMNVGLGQ